MTTLDFAKSILIDEDKYGPNLCELAKALVETHARIATLTEERDRALLYMSSDDVPEALKKYAEAIRALGAGK